MKNTMFVIVIVSLLLVMHVFVPEVSAVESSQPTHFADLRRFFHGEQATPPKALPPKRIAAITTDSGTTVDVQIESFLRAFASALMARDAKPLLARLSPQYSIDDLVTGKQAVAVFTQAIEQLPGPTDIVVTSIERKGDVRTIKVDFHFAADNIKHKVMRFDAGGRLLWTDLFSIKQQFKAV